MKPPRVFQSHLDFYHGELDQAPRDLFEIEKTYRLTFEDAVSRVDDGDQSVLPAFYWSCRSLLLNQRSRLARKSHYASHASMARGVSSTSEAHGSCDGPMFV
jgi:hypothetical protein